MGRSGGGPKGRKIIWAAVQDVDRGDPGVPSLTKTFQHCGDHSGKGSCVGIIQSSGGVGIYYPLIPD